MMTGKGGILEELAGPALVLPDLLADALAANNRIKFALSWLQSAEALANGANAGTLGELEPERTIAGLSDDPIYAPPAEAIRGNGGFDVPHGGTVVGRLLADVTRMCAATDAAAQTGVFDATLAKRMREREEAFQQSIHVSGDRLPTGLVSTLSQAPQANHDTVHALVMDLHKALNGIAVDLGHDDVAGARTYRLEEQDKVRVAAFMRGLNRTAALKLGHPGLATTAMRDGGRLMIQNDLGTTDAHVLIAYVEGRQLSVTHSDIHWRRLDFFCRRLDRFSWTVSNRRAVGLEEEVFELATGVLDAPSLDALDEWLERLGASLVYLIDWNKARKSLSRLVPQTDAIAILNWGADQEVGHRGYLEVGGDALVADLLETVSKTAGGFYSTLQIAVGADGAVEFLREMLRVASVGLRSGRSPTAIRDVLRADLLARVASVGDRIVEVALEHALLILDLANLVRTTLLDGRAASEQVARRAKAWEATADRRVTQIRELCGAGQERPWRPIASAADDAADDFEETAFRLQFLPAAVPPEIRDGLLRLAEHAVTAVKDYVRLLSKLRDVHRGAPRDDIHAFLELVERLHEWEHATDDAEREVFACLMRADVSAQTLNVVAAVAGGLEDVGDALLRTGRMLSDHVLGEWFAV